MISDLTVFKGSGREEGACLFKAKGCFKKKLTRKKPHRTYTNIDNNKVYFKYWVFFFLLNVLVSNFFFLEIEMKSVIINGVNCCSDQSGWRYPANLQNVNGVLFSSKSRSLTSQNGKCMGGVVTIYQTVSFSKLCFDCNCK